MGLWRGGRIDIEWIIIVIESVRHVVWSSGLGVRGVALVVSLGDLFTRLDVEQRFIHDPNGFRIM
jgi:hypothetical protein